MDEPKKKVTLTFSVMLDGRPVYLEVDARRIEQSVPADEWEQVKPPCPHRTWGWRRNIGEQSQRHCLKCGEDLPEDPPLERAHHPFAICSDTKCPQCLGQHNA